jgi:hypothetical protein
MAIVLEGRRHCFELAAPLDVHAFVRVDQDVADRLVSQQRLERPETKYFIQDVAENRIAFAHRQRDAGFGDQARDQRSDLALDLAPLRCGQLLEVQPGQKFAMHRAAHFEVLGTPGVVGLRSRNRRGLGLWGCCGGHRRLKDSQERRARLRLIRRRRTLLWRHDLFGELGELRREL